MILEQICSLEFCSYILLHLALGDEERFASGLRRLVYRAQKAGGIFTQIVSMQEVKMSACWIFMVFLGFGLSHATEPLSSCTCDGQLKMVCVPASHNVSVPCPHTNAQDLIFSLFKGQEMIATQSFTHKNNTTSSAEIVIRPGLELRSNTTDRSVSFVLSGVTANSSGMYDCKAQTTYPPPTQKIRNASKVMLMVEGHQCKCNVDCDGGQTPLWIWILGFVAVSAYGLAATIIALVIWLRLRKTECQTDYMNTRPRAPKGQRRKKGVQHPVPRHF